jgi:hypothetical protein
MYKEDMPMKDAKKQNQAGMKMKGEMGYSGKVEHISMPRPADMAKVKPRNMHDKGYDKKAWEYKY